MQDFIIYAVGYHNNTLANDGQQFKSTACFFTIGAKDADDDDCVRLSDLKVTGYLEDGLDMGGCWGDVWIDMLHTNGDNLYVDDMVKSYLWYDEAGEYEAGWYDESEIPLKNNESVLGNADEIPFEMGEGICVNSRNGYDGCFLEFPKMELGK